MNQDLVLVTDIETAGRLAGCKSRSSAYSAAKEGRIPVMQLGPRRRVVPLGQLAAVLGTDLATVRRALAELLPTDAA